MKGFSNKFKIPTLLGLGIIFLGIAAGVFLTLREQNFISKASLDNLPQNITLANISDTEVNISWQTSKEVSSFITFGVNNPSEQTVLDDRDTNPPAGGPIPHLLHYVTIKNLLPKTTYQYKIFSGKIASEVGKFQTASPVTSQTGFRPIIGSVLDGEKPLDEGLVYLSIADATLQAALIKTSGNFLIPVSQIRKSDLSDNFPLTEDTTLKLNIISVSGQSSAIFKLKDSKMGLPPIKLGENLDLTSNIAPSSNDLKKYDLNDDGKINAADNAILLQNFSKKGQGIKGDLNGDGTVDQKDLDLMSKQINQ